MLGVIEISAKLAEKGSKTYFRINSDTQKIKRIGVIADQKTVYEAITKTATIKYSLPEVHICYVSILLNNSKDKIILDVPVDFKTFEYVGSNYNNTGSLLKKKSFLENLLPVNIDIVKNTQHVIIFKAHKSFYNLQTMNKELFNALKNMNYNLYYEY